MINKITICQDAFYAEFFSDNGTPYQQEITGEKLLKSLRVPCKLNANLTLRDICLLLEKHTDLKKIIGYHSLALDYMDQCNLRIITGQKQSQDIEYLEIYKFAELSHEDFAYFEYYSVCQGVGFEDQNSNEKIHYGLISSCFEEYGGLKIVLNDKMEINQINKNFQIECLKKVSVSFSLLDVLSTIYYELTFFGV